MLGFTIFDKVSGVYSTPTFVYNEDDAKRRVAAAYKDNPFTGDLSVYETCRFDEFSGKTIVPEKPVFLYSVTDIVEEFYGK